MGSQTEGLVIGGTILGIFGLVIYAVLGTDKGPIDDPNVPPISRDTQNFLETNLPNLDKEPMPSVDRHVGSFSYSKGGKRSCKRKNKSKNNKSKKR